MSIKQFFALTALIASSAAFAADTVNIDLSTQATRSREAVAAETARALAAGEIKNGPLVEMLALIEPAPNRAMAQQTAPARKDADTQVAALPTTSKK